MQDAGKHGFALLLVLQVFHFLFFIFVIVLHIQAFAHFLISDSAISGVWSVCVYDDIEMTLNVQYNTSPKYSSCLQRMG